MVGGEPVNEPTQEDAIATLTANPRDLLEQAPMSRAQKIAIALTAILSALDGYDILSISFAAPAISAEWGVSKSALGLVFSSGLVGMMAGSFFLAPLGDRIGRRRIVIIALLLMGSGMALSATATSIATLATWRVATGIGLGAMVAVINPLAVEFANARYRTMAMAVMSIGFPLGGMIGGFAAAALLQHYSWEAVFLGGAAASLLLLPFVLVWLPESLGFLLSRRDERSLGRVNALLARCGHAPVAALPPVPPETPPTPYREIFSGVQLVPTLAITAVNFLFMLAAYYFLSWLPQIVADKGFAPSAGSSISAISNLCGVGASILFGVAALRWPVKRMAAIVAAGLGGSILLFGFAPADLGMLTIAAALVGIFLYGGITGIFTLIADSYAPRMRMTGVGFTMGVGRIAGALAPALAGMLFAGGASPVLVSALMSACAFTAALVLAAMRARSRLSPGFA